MNIFLRHHGRAGRQRERLRVEAEPVAECGAIRWPTGGDAAVISCP
jgi:hypothetical protein